MSPELRQIIDAKWFRPRGASSPERSTQAREIDQLSDAIRHELTSLFWECDGNAASAAPSNEDLAQLIDAIALVEYGLDGTLLWPKDLRSRAWERAAASLHWSVERLSEFDTWWHASSHHREFSHSL